MTFYAQPLVLLTNTERTWGQSGDGYTLATQIPRTILFSEGKYWFAGYFEIVSNYPEYNGGYTECSHLPVPYSWPDASAGYDASQVDLGYHYGPWWGLTPSGESNYATFYPGLVWDGQTVTVNYGSSIDSGIATPISLSVGVDGSRHYLQLSSGAYTYLSNTYGHQHTLGQASRAPGVGHISTHQFYAVSETEMYIFYEKASGSKFPIHVWTWNGTAWDSGVQLQDNGTATNGVHYEVKAVIRADPTNTDHLLFVLQDGQLIWVDLSDNSSSTTAITTGLPVDEWPKCVTPEVISGSNYAWGFNQAGVLAAKLVWVDANWKTPTVTKWTSCGTPTDSLVYDGVGNVRTTWGFARNPTTNETRALMLKYGQSLEKYTISVASLDLMAVSPSWSNYSVALHNGRIVDIRNYEYPPAQGWLVPRYFGYGTDWSNEHKSLCFGVLSAGISGAFNSYAQKVLIDWWTENTGFFVPSNTITVTPLVTITVSAYVDAGAKVLIEPQLVWTLTPQHTKGWWWPSNYTLRNNASEVTGQVLIAPQLVLTITPDDTEIRVIVNIAPQLTVTITEEVIQVATATPEHHSVFWDLDFTEDVMDLINAYRASQGPPLPPYKLMTLAMQTGKTDVAQLHAEDMANADLIAVESASFPAGRQTLAELQTLGDLGGFQMNVGIMALKQDYTGNGDNDSQRIILNQHTHATAQEVYDYFSPTAQALFLQEFPHNNIYLMLGVAYKHSTNYYPSYGASQWFTLLGGEFSIGGGGVEPTPFTNELGLQVSAPFLGTSWHQHFLYLVNLRREAIGLDPYLDPTALNYTLREDVAQAHSVNMEAAQVFAHDSTSFPVGYQTMGQRAYRTPTPSFAENLIEQVQTSPVFSDATFPTPQQALDTWWMSVEHRANLLMAWDQPMSSFMGIYFGDADTVSVGNGLPYAWYLTHNILDLTEHVVETYLNVNYQFNGALIEYLIEGYSLTTYVPVTADHQSKWSVKVAQSHEGEYGARVAAQHEAPLSYRVSQYNQAPYVGTVPAKGDHSGGWRLWGTYPVQQANEALYTARLFAGHEAQYDSFSGLRVGHMAFYDEMVRTRAALTSLYTLRATLKQAHEAKYAHTVNVRRDNEGEWDIRSVNFVKGDSKAFWSISGGAGSITSAVATVTVNGITIDISDAVVSQSESSFAWEAAIRLADVGDYAQIREFDDVILTLGGESYYLIVITKSLRRESPVKIDAQIKAVSALVLAGDPYATKGSFTLPVIATAKEAVEALLGPVTWELVDWTIPANRIKFENVTPLEAASRIVDTAGGWIKAAKDGSTVVSSLYPVPTHWWSTETPNHTFTDDEDTISVSEDHQVKKEYNRFRLMEGESSFNDKIEWEPNEGSVTHGKVLAYPSPWRDNFTVYPTDDITVLSYVGEQTREEEEQVQFSSGTGGLRYPILSITNIRWHSTPLGGLAFDVGSTSLTAPVDVNYGWGLATITYQTRAYEYTMVGVLGESTLLLMEDLGE